MKCLKRIFKLQDSLHRDATNGVTRIFKLDAFAKQLQLQGLAGEHGLYLKEGVLRCLVMLEYESKYIHIRSLQGLTAVLGLISL